MNKPIDVSRDPRLSGRVQRYHTWPILRPQSVGEHSWQIARILLTIAPNSPRLLHYAIVHDMGEVGTGDVPYPVKKNNPELARIMNQLEADVLTDMAYEHSAPFDIEISTDEKWVFKIAEYIEMWETAREERMIGNRFMALVEERCLEAANAMLADPPATVNPDLLTRALRYIKVREDVWE